MHSNVIKVKVCPARRVNEFPNKHLTVILGKLFCSACRETLAVKKSTVSNHVRSSKHLTSKEKLKFKKAREQSIALSLKKYDSSGRHEGDRSVYLSAILRHSTDIWEWRKSNETVLPNWGGAARKALLVQPSSAASERVFSLLNNTFGKKQNNSLEDYVESCIILQYNNR